MRIILFAVLLLASSASAGKLINDQVQGDLISSTSGWKCIHQDHLGRQKDCSPISLHSNTIPPMPDGPVCEDKSLGVWKACTPSQLKQYMQSKSSPSCETQLREALQAVEPYLSWTPPPINTTLLYVPYDERSRLQDMIKAIDQRDKVEAQYQAALKECGKP